VSTEDVRGAAAPAPALSRSPLLAEVLLRDVEWIAERSAARMQELLPSYARVPRHELTPVVRANTRNILEAICDPGADRMRARVQHVASGNTRARQGITSDEMLHAWRIGLEGIREQAHAVADEHGIGKDVLLEFVEDTLRWGDIGMRASAWAHHEAEIRELGRLVEEQAALRRVATMVAREGSADAVLAKVAEEVALLLGADLAAIHRFDADGYETIVGAWGTDDALRVGSRRKLAQGSTAGMVYRTGQPVSGVITAESRELGVHASVASPIVVNGRLWGAIAAGASRAEPLPDGAESRIAEFTELVATAIANVQARADLERLAEEQAALRRVATSVARECPAEEILAKVAEEVGQILAADAVVIHRFEPDGHATAVGSWGKLREAIPVGSRWKLDGDSVASLVYRTQRPGRFDRYEHASGALAGESREVGLRSAVASPVVVNGRLWGAIAAGTSRAEPMPVDAESRIAQFTELVATAISNVQARSDLAASRARIVAAADDERRRVVRDLHDGAQARLVHTIVTLKLTRRELERYGADAAALVDEPLQHATTANDEIRELAHGILPSSLTHRGLGEAVWSLTSGTSIPVEIDIPVDRFPRVVEATAYFIVAEALTNVAKHAHAQHATITARLEDRALQVEVRDDGVGGARADGTGLVGLSDRLAALNGKLRVESPPGGGTVIAASIPVR
jgi:signal transduction histidine kinase